jgi:pimeloyl-ACP methyl ester carboxylesterase
MWLPFPLSFNENYELMRPRRAHIDTPDNPKEWEIVLLHGWHSTYEPMMRLDSALRQQFPDARIWSGVYDSHWKTFTRSAREFAYAMRHKKLRPEKTFIVGYSMGGIVARSIVANGFAARGVACLASPHLGAAPWLGFTDVGSASIGPQSFRLRTLNNNPIDRQRRKDYFFQAFTFRDRSGFCRHDRVVTLRSSSGRGLENVGKVVVKHLEYTGYAPDVNPHLQGMNPEQLGEFFEWLRSRMSEENQNEAGTE